MKRTFYALFIMALLATISRCGDNKPVLELVEDQYGIVQKINPQEKYVYLIFTGHFSQDDNGYFENFDGAEFVVKTMAEHGVKGSFFPTGVVFREEKYQQVFRDIISQGHYLSGHSFNHLLFSGGRDRTDLVSLDSIAIDNHKMEAELQKLGLTKEQYVWMVPPYEQSSQFCADAYRSLGYKLANPTPGINTGADWTAPDHRRYRSAEQLINHLWEFEKENTLNGAIILIHAMDYPVRTHEDRPYRHLGEIITRLKELGYGFKTFWDVIKMEAKQ